MPLILHLDMDKSRENAEESGEDAQRYHLAPKTADIALSPDIQPTRLERLKRFLSKRKKRLYGKHVTYVCRKSVADRRKRVKGRFVGVDETAPAAIEVRAKLEATAPAPTDTRPPEPISLAPPEPRLVRLMPSPPSTTHESAPSIVNDEDDDSGSDSDRPEPFSALATPVTFPRAVANTMFHPTHPGAPLGPYPQISPAYSPDRGSPVGGVALPGLGNVGYAKPMDFEEFMKTTR